ncbi:MAG: ubiquinol-cytochrome c reductase iron-sulfur subunit [Gammaproteobacteria bacterium]|nr:ubiquinol-cytochrome c reductase iron-sulfur subunit [Gammaproteobacteria bacterium]
MSTNGVDKKRRRFLVNLTAGVGAVGSGFAVAPFVMSMTPSERAKAAGAPVEVDISKLEPGQLLTVKWRGKPVWLLNRTPVMMDSLKGLADILEDPESTDAEQPTYAKGIARAIKPELLVVVGLCTHLGCSPDKKLEAGAGAGLGADWPGGFFCPCHGSKFDLSGRVYKNVPAPRNLPVPPYSFKSDTEIVLGIDQKEGVA